MSWQLAILLLLALVLLAGVVWFERSRPSARILAAVAALAALGVAGRVALAPVPNVVATTDIALLAGYTLGGAPGFAVGALSALISNFWLGQGPWTPWQMAGWGLVGVGGAALAVLTVRRLGRWGLAIAAAAAGLLYGALLDLSVMVNFGGEQSLDRYLALSARAIPFNVAHALGNAALMLAAGPALVRMLDRYRERFEVDWRGARALGAPLAAALLALAIAVPLLAAPPAAGDAGPAAGKRSGASASGSGDTRRWLAAAQDRDGGWGVAPGASSNPGMTGWAMLGLEAAGKNPRDLKRAGDDPVAYLRRNSDAISSTGDLERTILALRGAGVGVRDFAGRDLLAELDRRQRSDGSYQRQVNLTAFAVLARSAAGAGRGSMRSAADWLRGAQRNDGGWGTSRRAPSDPDSTGAVLQALGIAAPGAGAIGRGISWLRGAQRNDGGWSVTPGAASNSQSTAWALQGLIAAGVDPGAVRSGGRSGLDYLAARKRGDGHYSYSRSSDQTPVWVTAQVLAAVEQESFPIDPVERRSRSGGGLGSGSGSGRASASRASGSGAAGSGGASASASTATKARGEDGRAKPGREPDRAAGGGPKGAESNPQVAASPVAALGSEQTEDGGTNLPASPVLLAGLGALAVLLAAGYLLYRRRLS